MIIILRRNTKNLIQGGWGWGKNLIINLNMGGGGLSSEANTYKNCINSNTSAILPVNENVTCTKFLNIFLRLIQIK